MNTKKNSSLLIINGGFIGGDDSNEELNCNEEPLLPTEFNGRDGYHPILDRSIDDDEAPLLPTGLVLKKRTVENTDGTNDEDDIV